MAESPPLPPPQEQQRSLIILDSPASFQPQLPPPPPPSPQKQPFGLFSFQRPPIRVTTEFDSDSSIFFHKVSSKFFDGLAKLKLSFHNNSKGEIADPQIAVVTRHLAAHFDVVEQNAFLKGSLDVGPNLRLRGAHDVKARQGEVAVTADLADPAYKFELASSVPSTGLPRATITFPFGEVSLEEKEDAEVKRYLSINSILKGSILNGVCTAFYKDENMTLRYCYKDEEMSFIPSISLPSNAVSFGFKRRFSPSDKLSYWYNFDTDYWSTVYKYTVGKDYKFKAGYDSEVRLGWASLWVGDEGGKVNMAPKKIKVQFMLQVPQDDIKSSVLMFRVKKRWDL